MQLHQEESPLRHRPRHHHLVTPAWSGLIPAYEISESCRNEIRLSLNRGKRIFPVLAATLKQSPKVPLPDGKFNFSFLSLSTFFFFFFFFLFQTPTCS